MMHGGKRPGAGRPKGAVNKSTQQLQRNIKNSGLTPVEHMLKVMRNPRASAQRRDWAAAAAAPYIHPRIQAVQSEPEKPILQEQEDQIDMIAFARQVALVLYLADKKLEKEEDEDPKPKLDKLLD